MSDRREIRAALGRALRAHDRAAAVATALRAVDGGEVSILDL